MAAPGNHEFDYGYENLTKLAGAAEFPILAANITYEGKLAFGDNVTFEAPDGTKIGVFGLDTPETASKANPAKIRACPSPAARRCTRSPRLRWTP